MITNFSLTKHLDHSPIGGESVFGKDYKGGEFLPFYIPRDQMPQVNEEDYKALFEFLGSNNVPVAFYNVPTLEIHPHQRVNIAKLRREMYAEPKYVRDIYLRKAILISMDNFIIDGHHRWDFHILNNDKLVPVRKIMTGFNDALKLIFEFPKTQTTNEPT